VKEKTLALKSSKSVLQVCAVLVANPDTAVSSIDTTYPDLKFASESQMKQKQQ